jgi:hypothetical protein
MISNSYSISSFLGAAPLRCEGKSMWGDRKTVKEKEKDFISFF